MKKIIFSIIALLVLGWYLFIKQNDYIISFEEKTASGTIYQGVQEWATSRLKTDKESYTTLEKSKYNYIKQRLSNKKNVLEYNWQLTPVNDSVTKISVGIKDLNNSIYNRLTVPFFSTIFKKEQIKKISDFKKGLDEHLKEFKVKIDGEGQSQETYVAYINLKSVMQEKAQEMIANDATITGYIARNNIKIVGKPYVEINAWNQDKETLDFNYCFPVDKNTKIVDDPKVKFKTIKAIKGLTATYYGNFRKSDRAWFALLDYAKTHDIKLENKPLEHFLDNPFNGGNELEWKTEIIIPFQK